MAGKYLEPLRRALRGDDRVAPVPWPVGEALHPVAVVAALVLIANDWWWKTTSWAGPVTGKLSDVAGLMIAPVVLTAVVDAGLQLAWRLGAPVNPVLRPWKVWAAVALTAGVFTAVKLSPELAGWLAETLMPGRARIVADWTDLFALPALWVAVWIGADELRRGPLGALAWRARADQRRDRSSPS